MLDENQLDELLESITKKANDDLLKAKTPEEKAKAYENCKDLHKICNERIKIQNDRYISEGKLKLDAEKFDDDVDYKKEVLASEKKSKKKEWWVDFGFKALKTAAVLGVVVSEFIMLDNSLIKTNDVSKSVSKSGMGTFGKWLL